MSMAVDSEMKDSSCTALKTAYVYLYSILMNCCTEVYEWGIGSVCLAWIDSTVSCVQVDSDPDSFLVILCFAFSLLGRRMFFQHAQHGAGRRG